MQEIKRQFFTYRNGMLADTLRGYGYPYKVIFGLELPRIAEIAGGLTPSVEMAERLWEDREVRESRLLATYLYPVAAMTEERAEAMASDVRTQEEADMLAFRIFKRMEHAAELLARLRKKPACRRAADALAAHLEG
ncbi:MAG: hypothetical protein ACI304_09215 [Lepagella sp.]